jgi:hypothetical protein
MPLPVNPIKASRKRIEHVHHDSTSMSASIGVEYALTVAPDKLLNGEVIPFGYRFVAGPRLRRSPGHVS